MLALIVDVGLIGTLAFLGLAVWRLGTIVERYALLGAWGRVRCPATPGSRADGLGLGRPWP